jgi:nucleoid DNA-binding protein
MTLSEIVDRVIRRIEGSRVEKEFLWELLQETIDEVALVLGRGEEVKIRGLGRLYWAPVKRTTKRLAGKDISVPDGWRLKFDPAGPFRRRTKMPEDKDEGLTKLGVVLDGNKTKTAGEGDSVRICPVCGKELDDAGACPVHGTEPFEPDGQGD